MKSASFLKVSVFSLSSQPVDGSGGNGRQKGRLGDVEDDRTETCSDDDDDDYTSPESDSADDTPRFVLPDVCFFKPKIPIWVNFGRPCNGRCLYYFYGYIIYVMAIWYILW
jgi:hypothetical protein